MVIQFGWSPSFAHVCTLSQSGYQGCSPGAGAAQLPCQEKYEEQQLSSDAKKYELGIQFGWRPSFVHVLVVCQSGYHGFTTVPGRYVGGGVGGGDGPGSGVGISVFGIDVGFDVIGFEVGLGVTGGDGPVPH